MASAGSPAPEVKTSENTMNQSQDSDEPTNNTGSQNDLVSSLGSPGESDLAKIMDLAGSDNKNAPIAHSDRPTAIAKPPKEEELPSNTDSQEVAQAIVSGQVEEMEKSEPEGDKKDDQPHSDVKGLGQGEPEDNAEEAEKDKNAGLGEQEQEDSAADATEEDEDRASDITRFPERNQNENSSDEKNRGGIGEDAGKESEISDLETKLKAGSATIEEMKKLRDLEKVHVEEKRNSLTDRVLNGTATDEEIEKLFDLNQSLKRAA